VNKYALCVSIAFLISGVVSIALSKAILNIKESRIVFLMSGCNKVNNHNASNINIPSINVLLIFVLSVQFLAMSFAYAMCMVFVSYRLVIISVAPALSMLGTISAAVFIEPKLAKYIDADPRCGFEVSSKYLVARGISFCISAIIFVSLMFYDIYAS
jgi:hypothetical protein